MSQSSAHAIMCIKTAAAHAFAEVLSRFDETRCPKMLENLEDCVDAMLNQQCLPDTEHTSMFRRDIVEHFAKISGGSVLLEGLEAFKRHLESRRIREAAALSQVA